MGRSDHDVRDNFWESGPTHLTQTEIDWDNNDHRRCITASLVKGTYVLESDQTKKRENTPNALAPAWWETFHFRKIQEFRLTRRCVMCELRRVLGGKLFIYGAAFEYAPPQPADNGGVPRHRHPSAPSHVVAFRGTMIRDPTILSDMRQNLSIMVNKQHTCARFTDARQHVQRLLLGDKTDDDDDDDKNSGRGGEISETASCWLAGHSLGASIALDVGRHMMMIHRGLSLPTFLFNPPHPSLGPAIGEQARRDVYAAGYFLKYALMSKVIPSSSHKDHMEEVFEKLATWAPNVYVNPLDGVCEGYIHYFEQRQRMMERHPSVARLAAKLSFRDMWRAAVRGKETERPHLLPSVVLWKNTRSQEDAHGLRQWWQPRGTELDLWTNEYRWSF